MNKVIYANIICADALSRNEKLFLSDLISFTRNQKYVFAGNAYFAEQYGVTIRTVNRWLEKLKKLELINTRLIRQTRSFMVTKRYIYVDMDKINALECSPGATDTLISDDIQYNQSIPKSEKHMLAMLTKYSMKLGYVYAADDHFAKIFGVHRTTVRRWLRQLAVSGYIKIDQGRFFRRIFIVCAQVAMAAGRAVRRFYFFNMCKNVMYSVTSFLHARIKKFLYTLCNFMHIHSP